jgi:L-fuconolactonase
VRNIDAHMHLWDPARGDYGWLTPSQPRLYRPFRHDEAALLLKAHQIDGAVLVQAAPSDAETDYLLEIAASVPWVLGVVGWVDMDAADATDTIARRCGQSKFVGIRPMLQDLPNAEWILHPRRSRALEALQGHQLVLDALIRPAHLPVLVRLASDYPELQIVIDHAAKPSIGWQIDEMWQSAMHRLAGNQNVSCKVSGLLTELAPGVDIAMIVPYVKALIDLFGPDRLVWGSDWPVLTLAGSYSDWMNLSRDALCGVSPKHIDAIMGGNAIRTYRLGARA